ncbi:hypothetical protein VTN77DRAFT_6583 [Rasamsonia byssochlamydoides]|uniref:uncharacterized protein n=1 Tax=Rasamsonia byssochlamydoides TaxID=89139 RepID=UPI003742049A
MAADRSSIASILLNYLLFCIIVLSYVPQYCRLQSRRTTDGLSPWFILLRAVSTTANLANLLILPAASAAMDYCRTEYSVGRCVVELVTHWQVAADWIGSHVILFLYGRYYCRDVPRKTRTATSIITISLVFDVLLLGPSLFLDINPPIPSPGYYNLMRRIWSFTTIAISTLLALICHWPQFYHTGTLKRVGSLSVDTLCVQTVAYFLLAVSLWERFGIPADGLWYQYMDAFNMWITYLIMGVQAGVLLVESIYVAYAYASTYAYSPSALEGPPAPDDANPVVDEQTPLLASRP